MKLDLDAVFCFSMPAKVPGEGSCLPLVPRNRCQAPSQNASPKYVLPGQNISHNSLDILHSFHVQKTNSILSNTVRTP